MRKTEGLVKYPVTFLKPIRIQYELMAIIFKIPLQTCPCKQCVPVPMIIMGYRTGNVCNIVVINAQVLSYPVRRQIKIQQTYVQQYNLMLTVMFHIIMFTGNIHTMNEQHVHCVP